MASLDVGRVPVLDPIDRRVVGVFRRGDVVRAYQRGITRSLGSQQRAQAGRLRDLSGVRFIELVVTPDSPLADARVRDVRWPRNTVLTSVRAGSGRSWSPPERRSCGPAMSWSC
jgi:chloride channel protein, CIC family